MSGRIFRRGQRFFIRLVGASTRFLASCLAVSILAYAGPVRAQVSPPTPPCDSVSGTSATCSGNVSGGVSASAPYTSLSVTTSQDIAPASGVPGVELTSSSGADLTLKFDVTGAPHGIITTNAPGIVVENFGSPVNGSMLIRGTGNISTSGDYVYGVEAENVGSASNGSNVVNGNQTITIGNVSTAGYEAYGILAYNEAYDYGTTESQLTNGNQTITAGNIATMGDYAYGVYVYNEAYNNYVYSGTGDYTITNGNETVSLGDVSTSGYDSYGIVAYNEAYGYGGGSNFLSVSNGNQTITAGNISTLGANAYGVYAYNAGEIGYGTAASESAINGSQTIKVGNVSTSGSDSVGIEAGNYAEAFINGTTGNVNVINGKQTITAGDITMTGIYSYGIYTYNEAEAWGNSGSTADVSLSNGDQTITVGNISATGYGAYGIVANDIAMISGAAAGNASLTNGNLTITTGNISATGDSTYGIEAITEATASSSGLTSVTNGNLTINSNGTISVGNNGIGISASLQTYAYGASTTVVPGILTINTRGDITTGTGGTGITTSNYSDGGASGDVAINIFGGTVSAGSGGTAVKMTYGAQNVLTNYGTVTAADGLSGQAIYANSGDAATVANYRTVTGNVNLDDSVNVFNNKSGGLFNMGSDIELNGGTLTNAGVIAPGGSGNIFTSTLSGNLTQTSAGKLAIDIDMNANTSDHLTVEGTANLAGTVVVKPVTVKLGAHQQYDIVDSMDPINHSGLGVTTVSAAVSASLFYPDANDVWLDVAQDFAATGLNPNQTAVGNTLNSIFLQSSGSAKMNALVGPLFSLETVGELGKAYDQLSPEIYNLAAIEGLYGSQQFSNDMMSCRVAGDDGAAFIREGQCVWARARGRFLDIDRTSKNIGATDTTGSFAAGGQVAVAPDVRLGFAAGYDRVNLDTSNGASRSDPVDKCHLHLFERRWAPERS